MNALRIFMLYFHGFFKIEQVEDVNDQPTSISLSSNVVSENSSPGTVVGDLSTKDDDAGQTYTFSIINTVGMLFISSIFVILFASHSCKVFFHVSRILIVFSVQHTHIPSIVETCIFARKLGHSW